MNLYVYTGNDPINATDPTGLQARPPPPSRPPVRPVAQVPPSARAPGSLPPMVRQQLPPSNVTGPAVTPKNDGGITPTGRIIRKNLSGRDINAARAEAAGSIVARRSDGKPYDHRNEIQEGQQALRNRMNEIKKKLKGWGLLIIIKMLKEGVAF